ncbi:MAG: LacI family transcriptional regulator [Carboxylicivirga sp.]|jgi:LacI family transcriptional regulator|nr:LacI family transcriptional regulator [Carboxylicivirga sp.]
MNERITIKDIAKALNIHHSTVSRALRGDKRVKEQTKKRIKEFALANGYQINVAAIELRGGRRNAIAIIVPNINHQFFSNVISSFTNLACDNDFVVSIFQTNENYEQEKKVVDTIIQQNFAGVIASISMESKEMEHFEKLKQQNIPLVMFDRVSSRIEVPKVTINNQQIMQDVVALLLKKGHKRITHISGPSYLNVFGERQTGYHLAIEKHQLEYEKLNVINHGFTIADGVKMAGKLLESDDRPDAIISDSSNLMLGLIKELRNRDIKIPQEMALVTFGESQIFEIFEPSVACIMQPDEAIAKNAYELLIKSIQNSDENDNRTVTLSAKIMNNKYL